MSRSRLALLAIPALAGCQLLIGLDGGKPGSGGSTTTGGAGAGGTTSSSSSSTSAGGSTTTSSSVGGGGGTTSSTSTSSTSTSSTSSSSSTSTSSSTSSASGDACDGGQGCSQPSDCGDPLNDCLDLACASSCCSVTPKAKGTTCSTGGGKVCGTGATAGTCVGCNDAADCGSGMLCLANRCSAMALIASSASEVFGAAYAASGWSSPTTVGGSSTDDLALAFTTAGKAVGAYRLPHIGVAIDDQVWFTTWTTGTWATGVAIDATKIFARAGASVSAGDGTAQLLFQGTDYKHYFLAFAGTWSAAQPLQVAGPVDSFGPTPGAIAARGADATAVFFDGSSGNQVTAQDRVASAWQAKAAMGTKASDKYLPAVVALTGGSAELLAIYADNASNQIYWQTRTGTTWSSPTTIGAASTFTQGRPALAPLPNGGAVMAFQGTDNRLYFATYDGSQWSTVTTYGSGINVVWMPSLARGLTGAAAEIAFIKASDNSVYHARLVGGIWTQESKVGSQAAARVAIATFP